MIKVIHLISGLEVGGAEKQLIQLVSLSNPNRFKHIIISMQTEGVLGAVLNQKNHINKPLDNIHSNNIKIYSLGMKRGRISIQGFFKLIAILIKEKPTILQTWLYHADLMGLLAGKFSRIPKIIWNIRCSNMDLSQYSTLTSFVIKLCSWFSSWPNAVVVNSKSGKKIHEQLGYRVNHWEWIPNGFRTNYFKPDVSARKRIRDTLHLNEDTILIAMVARFDPMKDHFSFLLAAKELLKTVPKARFALIGLGMETNNKVLMEKIENLQLQQHVLLMGVRLDMPEVMNAVDILTVASAFGEGFPNVIGEAMASKVLCVSTDVGDAALLIEDKSSIVEPANPLQLCEAWIKLITLNEESKEAMRDSARSKIVNEYDLTHIVGRYEKFYEMMI